MVDEQRGNERDATGHEPRRDGFYATSIAPAKPDGNAQK